MMTAVENSARTIDAPTSTATRHAPLGHIGSLDGVRGLAVIAVFLYHGSWLRVSGGFIGVDVFFAMSGFLITRLLVDEYHRAGSISLRQFFMRRALRLLPAVYALVGGVWLANWLLDMPTVDDRLPSRSFWALSYLANWHDIVTGTHGGPFSHLWSLSVEEQFYILWPLAAVAAFRAGGPAVVARWAAVGTLALSGITALRMLGGADPFDIYFGTESHGAILLLGGSWLGASPHLVGAIDRGIARMMTNAALAGLVVMALVPDRFNPIHVDLGYVPILFLSLAMVLGVVASREHRLLAAAPLRYVGRRSYAIYLWHIPMFPITGALVTTSSPLQSMTVIAIATVVAAEASHRIVEKPALKLKKRWASPVVRDSQPAR